MKKQKLAGHSILIVEPDPFIAIDLQDTFAHEGARVVTAFRLERALQLAERPTLSAAVIDSTLGAEDRGALCWRLAARKVPFVFHSERMTRELGDWPDVPLISKPADGNKVVEVVACLLGAGAAAPGEGGQTQVVPPITPDVAPVSWSRCCSAQIVSNRGRRSGVQAQPRMLLAIQ